MLFKLFINSRFMESWGIDTSVRFVGQVAKSFWMPSGQHEGESGLEERTFVFLPSRNRSMAEDGGIIEVKAFRASQRRLGSLELPEFQYRSNYGVAYVTFTLSRQIVWYLIVTKCPQDGSLG